jgi:hypothetical protein
MKTREKIFALSFGGFVSLLILVVALSISDELRFKILGLQPLQVEVKIKSESEDKNLRKLEFNAYYTSDYSINGLYTLDKNRLEYRHTPNEIGNIKNKHFLVFGCSYVFGAFLNDIETLPFYLSRLIPDYKLLNFGFPGGSPAYSFWSIDNNPELLDDLPSEGITFFIMIEDHLKRIAATQPYADIGMYSKSPYYQLGSGGSVEYLGTVGKFLELNLDFITDDEALKLATALLKNLKNKILDKYPKNDFYVVFYPGERKLKKLKPFLQKEGLTVLDLTENFADEVKTRGRDDEFFFASGHPKAKFNQKLAQLIVKKIRYKK